MNQNQIDGARFVKTGKRGQYTVEFTCTADGCVHQMHDVDNLDQAKALVRERLPGRCVLVLVIDAKDGECITTCNVGRNAAKPKAVAAKPAAEQPAAEQVEQPAAEQPAAEVVAAAAATVDALTATDCATLAAVTDTAIDALPAALQDSQKAVRAYALQKGFAFIDSDATDDGQPATIPIACTIGCTLGSDAAPEENEEEVRLVQAGENNWFRTTRQGWNKLTKRDVALVRDLFILGGCVRWCFVDMMDIGTIGGTYRDLNAALDRLVEIGLVALKGEAATRAAVLRLPAEATVTAFLADYDAWQEKAAATAAPTVKRTKQVLPALDYAAGTVLEKTWKGVQYFCTVKGDGTYEVTDAAGTTNGCTRTSLSGAARAVTGGSVNGKTFWKPAQPVTSGQDA